MIRRLRPLAVLLLVVCAAAVVWLLRVPAPSLPPSPVEAPPAAIAPVKQPVTTPAPVVPETESERPVADYDRYRREMRRIRAAREEAQALQDNERCIEGQRFRKVGSAWEPAGNC